MNQSTLKPSNFQYRKIFNCLFSTQLLRQSIQQTISHPTRDRLLPLYMIASLIIVRFYLPVCGLAAVARFFLLRWKRRLPCAAALCQAQFRLGLAPLRWLTQQVVRPLADYRVDPQAFYHGWRLLALDGTTFTTADTPENEQAFGRANNQHRSSGYPLLRAVALCEVGTRVLWAWLSAPFKTSETVLANQLLPEIPAHALLLADRNFHCALLWKTAARQRFELLIRVKSGPIFDIQEVLPDGSFLSCVYLKPRARKNKPRVPVRVIGYDWTDEKGVLHRCRLLTSLLDAVAYPARELVDLYHQRWQIERVFFEIKSTLQDRPMHLRSQSGPRVEQELEGILLGHYVLRYAMLQAARKQGISVLELSYRGTLRIVMHRINEGGQSKRQRRNWWRKLLEEMGAQRIETPRKRRCPRVRKITRCKWKQKRASDCEQTVPDFNISPPSIP